MAGFIPVPPPSRAPPAPRPPGPPFSQRLRGTRYRAHHSLTPLSARALSLSGLSVAVLCPVCLSSFPSSLSRLSRPIPLAASYSQLTTHHASSTVLPF